MPLPTVYKVQLSRAMLAAMPKEQSSALLRVGLFMNELNWLVRLLLIARIPNDTSEHERRATLSLAMMLVKLLAGKIHEGWNKLRTEIAPLIDASLSQEGRQARDELANRLAADSVVHRLRNRHAFHYSTRLSLEDLDALPLTDAELAMYMSENHGHNLFHASELAALGTFIDLTGEGDAGKAFQVVMREVVQAAGLYSDFLLAAVIALLGNDHIEQLNPEALSVTNGREASAERIMFFELPPRD